MHSKVEYIVAHGISIRIEGQKVIIGSYHFVFEDEKCVIPKGMEEQFEALPAYHIGSSSQYFYPCYQLKEHEESAGALGVFTLGSLQMRLVNPLSV